MYCSIYTLEIGTPSIINPQPEKITQTINNENMTEKNIQDISNKLDKNQSIYAIIEHRELKEEYTENNERFVHFIHKNEGIELEKKGFTNNDKGGHIKTDTIETLKKIMLE